MPQYNRAELGRMATESGFVRDTFEKVLRLKEILRFMNEDEFLREHLLLKGGTAINLTVFNLPRLSVDIDMDYTPNDTREDMLECREKITNVIKEYMESEGYLLSDASRFSHSLDAFHYNYQNAGGNRDMIKIELNYSLRGHQYGDIFFNYATQYVDKCNIEYLKTAPEKRKDKLRNIAKRFVQQPDAYKNMKRDLEYSAKQYGCSFHELHDPKLEYPEEIEW